jgi:Uma2 family endonuclease
MSTVSNPPRERAIPPEPQRFLLRAVNWQAYRSISDALKGRHLRLTYDRGNLELMTISGTHGNCSRLLGRFVFVLAEEFKLPIRSFGDMTCDSEELDRGVEPDESFYITNEPRVRAKEEIDLSVDPPPDLMLEVDITRSSRDRMGIYAAIRVPEVWSFDGRALRVWRLGADELYILGDSSIYFPSLPIHELATFLQRRTETDEVSLVRMFRAWVQDKLQENHKT